MIIGNMELWNKVKKRFEDHPQCVDMEVILDITPCGTVGCIAGWTIYEGSQKVEYGKLGKGNWLIQAASLLDIDEDRAHNLFYPTYWPDDIKKIYDQAPWNPARAVLAAMNAFERGEF